MIQREAWEGAARPSPGPAAGPPSAPCRGEVGGTDVSDLRILPHSSAHVGPAVDGGPRFGSRARAPRTRLNQALTVASGASSASIDPWGDGAERPPARRDVEPVRYRSEPQEVEVTPSAWGAARHDAFGPKHSQSEGAGAVTADDPVHLVVDLRAKALPASTGDASSNYGLGTSWGSNWRDSAQGWVPDQYGAAMWRPVVATTEDLAVWDVRTYLGIVTAEVAVEAHGGDFKQLGATLTRAREMGTEGLVEEAIARGAHAVRCTSLFCVIKVLLFQFVF